jgi:hypothetical protein
VASLLDEIENSGCLLAEGGRKGRNLRHYDLRLPGQDAVLLLNPSIQSFFWDRVQVRVDKERARLHLRWNYGSPGQMLLHGLITLMVLVSAPTGSIWICFLLAILGNLLPVGLSRWESIRFRTKLLKAGFKCQI